MYKYRNRSSRVQTLNLDSGKSIHVSPGEVVSLDGDDHMSPEVQAKLRGGNPTGQLSDDDASSVKTEVTKKTSDKPKQESPDIFAPRSGEKG